MCGALEGIQFASLTHFPQGPSFVQFLADLGADVIKAERAGGAFELHWFGAKALLEKDSSVFFLLAGRNRRSVEINFANRGGKRRAARPSKALRISAGHVESQASLAGTFAGILASAAGQPRRRRNISGSNV